MSLTMTCWKDIAHYLGKGVRTVQRWEQEMGLPVRRPHQRLKLVLAHSDELDAWMRDRFETGSGSELDVLRKKMADLESENGRLRAELERVERTPALVQSDETADDLDLWMDEVLRNRCSRAVQRNSAVRLDLAQIIEQSRNMKELRKLQKKQYLELSLSRSIH